MKSKLKFLALLPILVLLTGCNLKKWYEEISKRPIQPQIDAYENRNASIEKNMKILKSEEDPKNLVNAIKRLGELKAIEAVEDIANMLIHKNTDVHESAQYVLVTMGLNEMTISTTLLRLTDDELSRLKRERLGASLGQIAKEREDAFKLLLACAKGEHPMCRDDLNGAVKESALWGLGESGRFAAKDVLIKNLSHKNANLVSAAAKSLVKLIKEHAFIHPLVTQAYPTLPTIHAKLEVIRIMGETRLPEGKILLFEALKEENGELRFHAAKNISILAKLHTSVLAKLHLQLSHSDESIRSGSAHALFFTGHPSSVPFLLKAIDDSSKSVRIYVTHALGVISKSNPELKASLLEKLKDKNTKTDVRWSVTQRLWEQPDKDNLDILLEIAKDTSNDRMLRASAINAIGVIAKPKEIKNLFEVVVGLYESLPNDQESGAEWRLEGACYYALGEIGKRHPGAISKAYQPYLAHSSRHVRVFTILSLEDMPTDDALPLMYQGLESSDKKIQKASMVALDGSKAPSATKYLLEKLESSKSDVLNLRLVKVLEGHAYDKNKLYPEIIHAYKIQLTKRTEKSTQLAIMDIAGRGSIKDLIPEIKQIAIQSSDELKEKAFVTLGMLEAIEGVPIFIEALSNEREETKIAGLWGYGMLIPRLKKEKKFDSLPKVIAAAEAEVKKSTDQNKDLPVKLMGLYFTVLSGFGSDGEAALPFLKKMRESITNFQLKQQAYMAIIKIQHK